MDEPAIRVQQLTKRFRGRAAVNDLTFDVPTGRVTGFLGPNGAGKTTTLRMLLGLATPTSGTAAVLGGPYRNLDRPADVGILLDAAMFHPKRSARHHLRWVAAASDVHTERIETVLREVGLEDAADRRVGEFSLGMRQRLGLAGALLGEPRVLVLDEPANGLDPAGIRWMRGFLATFARAGGAVFVSSHQLGEMALLADEAVVINAGSLVTHTSIAELTSGAAGMTRVRTPDPERLLAILTERALTTTTRDDGSLLVSGSTPEEVGDLAGAAGIYLHELVSQPMSLEDVFLKITEGDKQ